jgi:methyl coenzyme M reductase alpha subunit
MRQTYFVELDHGCKLGPIIVETRVARTKDDVIDAIIYGEYEEYLRHIYRCALGEITEDVTDEIAQEVYQYGLKHQLGWTVLEWLDWCGLDMPEAAE